MHSNFWKYFAAISIFSCIFVIVVYLLWPHSGFGSVSTVTKINTMATGQEDEGLKKDYPKEEGTVDEKKYLTIFAAGDIMLDRTMLLLAQKYNDFGYAFRLISSTLREANLRVANLEGPITTNKSIANGIGGVRFSFTFSPKVTSSLKENFDIVSLANNHTTNFGFEGLEQTKNFLKEAGIGYFGDPNNRVGTELSTIVEKNGIKVAFVGFHELVGQGFDNVIAEIEKIRPEVDIIIAYPHWGTEYIMDRVNIAQTQEAHAMIDAGADLIIGAHPHVIQPVEMYKDKLIFYSLGNFIFDQYFSLETMQGLTLSITLEKDSTDVKAGIQLIPVHISKESQPFVAEIDEKSQILSDLSEASIGDEALKQGVKVGKLGVAIRLTQIR